MCILLGNVVVDNSASPCDQIEVSKNGVISKTDFGTGIFDKQNGTFNGRPWYKLELRRTYWPYNTIKQLLTYDNETSIWRVGYPFKYQTKMSKTIHKIIMKFF